MMTIWVYQLNVRHTPKGEGGLTTPAMMPAAPNPAMARPMMKDMLEGAAPHIADPISNKTIDARKVPLMLKKVYSLPKSS